MENIPFGFGTAAAAPSMSIGRSNPNSVKVNYYYHIFKHISNPGSYSYCVPEIPQEHQCVENKNKKDDQSAAILFKYERSVNYDQLNTALTSSYKEPERNEIINKLKLNKPFGFLNFKLPDYWLSHSYVIVKTTNTDIPILSSLLPPIPEYTKEPHDLTVVSGGRRKTKSRSYKKRRSTRRRNRRN